MPISIRDGLPRVDMRPPTNVELEKFPHVFITSDAPWDPAVLDEEFDETFHDAIMELPEVTESQANCDPRVDECGYLHRSQRDYKLIFQAQDKFIAANSPTKVDEVFYDSTSTGVTYLGPNGNSTIVYPKTTTSRLANMAQRLATTSLTLLPNRLKRLFPKMDALKPYFGWVSGSVSRNASRTLRSIIVEWHIIHSGSTSSRVSLALMSHVSMSG